MCYILRLDDHACAFQPVDSYGERGREGDDTDEVAFIDSGLGVEEIDVVEVGHGFSVFTFCIGVYSEVGDSK